MLMAMLGAWFPDFATAALCSPYNLDELFRLSSTANSPCGLKLDSRPSGSSSPKTVSQKASVGPGAW
jgi:hypothetical protein